MKNMLSPGSTSISWRTGCGQYVSTSFSYWPAPQQTRRSCSTIIISTGTAQYLSIAYSQALLEAGVAASVGSKGDAYDNALAETINGLYKTEVINHAARWGASWRECAVNDCYRDVLGPVVCVVRGSFGCSRVPLCWLVLVLFLVGVVW